MCSHYCSRQVKSVTHPKVFVRNLREAPSMKWQCAIFTVHCALSDCTTFFSHYLIKRKDFRKKNIIEHEKCILISSKTSAWNASQSKKRCARYGQKHISVFMYSTRYACQILIKLEFSRQIFEKYSNISNNENPSSGSWVVQCGQTEGRTDRLEEANQ